MPVRQQPLCHLAMNVLRAGSEQCMCVERAYNPGLIFMLPFRDTRFDGLQGYICSDRRAQGPGLDDTRDLEHGSERLKLRKVQCRTPLE